MVHFRKTSMTDTCNEVRQGTVSLHASTPARQNTEGLFSLHLMYNLDESVGQVDLVNSSGRVASGEDLGAVVVGGSWRDGLTDGLRRSKNLQIWLSAPKKGISTLLLLVQWSHIHNCRLYIVKSTVAMLLLSPAPSYALPYTHPYVAKTCITVSAGGWLVIDDAPLVNRASLNTTVVFILDGCGVALVKWLRKG